MTWKNPLPGTKLYHDILTCLREEQDLLDLKEQVNNTIFWKVDRSCQWCDCKTMRIVKTPQHHHYAHYICNVCGLHNDWIPKYMKEVIE